MVTILKYFIKLCHSFSFNCDEEKSVPISDRQRALSLLLELAMQRGTLQHILDAIILLLQLADKASKSNDHLKKPNGDVPVQGKQEEACCPLVPFLRRIASVATPQLLSKSPIAVRPCYTDVANVTHKFFTFRNKVLKLTQLRASWTISPFPTMTPLS